MKTLLEWIESWIPCHRYHDYIHSETLTPQTTIEDILFSVDFKACDKEWVFNRLLDIGDIFTVVRIHASHITLFVHSRRDFKFIAVYKYGYETFLAMVYEYIEHVDLEVAI